MLSLYRIKEHGMKQLDDKTIAESEQEIPDTTTRDGSIIMVLIVILIVVLFGLAFQTNAFGAEQQSLWY